MMTLQSVLCILVVISAVRNVQCLMCYSCQNVASQLSCQQKTTCQSDEECFTKRTLGAQASVTYTLGCEKRDICDAVGGGIGIVGRKRNVRSFGEKRNVDVCSQCCNSDLCNSALCQEHEGSGNNPQQGATHPVYVRILDGPDAYEGRVEVFYNDQWGTICDDSWTGEDASVICKMMGYSGTGSGGLGMAAYGVGYTRHIWLDDVNCTGNEQRIQDCPSNGWGNHDCHLNEDAGVLCSPVGPEDNVIFLLDTGNGGDIVRMDLNTNSYTILPTNTDYSPTSIDYEAKAGRIYFTDANIHQICSVHYDGFDIRELKQMGAGSALEKIEVDSINGKVFYTDTGLNHIGSMNLDGSGYHIIINSSLDEPRDIVLDSTDRVVYWTDWGKTPKIESSNYDGSNRKTIVSTGLSLPNGLAISYADRMLYFVDAGTFKIEAVDFNGNNRKEILKDAGTYFFSLAVYQDYLYYTDWDRRALMRINKDGSGNMQVGPADFQQLSDVRIHKYGVGPSAVTTQSPISYERDHVFARLVGNGYANEGRVEVYANGQWGTVCDDNWTDQNAAVVCGMLGFDRNGAKAFGNATHGSGDGLLIFFDEVNCQGTESNIVDCQIKEWASHDCSHQEDASVVCQDTTPNNFMIAVDSRIGEMYRFDLTTLSYTAIPQQNVYNPVAITYDPVAKKIYYSDVRLRVIRRTDINGQHEENFRVLNSKAVPDGLAIDAQNRMLFYTDAGNDVIMSIHLDGTNERTIISSNLDQPRGITLDTANRVVYWTDWGRSPKVEKANYDGTNRVAIITQNLGLPNGITLDNAGKLFFCDAGTKVIESMNTDGSARTVLFQDVASHYYGLSVDNTYIYYTDWRKLGVLRIKKDGTGEMMAGAPDFPRLDGVVLYHSKQ